MRLLGKGKTFVKLVPVDITVGSFMRTTLTEAGIQSQIPVSLTLNGRDIKPINSNFLQAYGVRN